MLVCILRHPIVLRILYKCITFIIMYVYTVNECNQSVKNLNDLHIQNENPIDNSNIENQLSAATSKMQANCSDLPKIN